MTSRHSVFALGFLASPTLAIAQDPRLPSVHYPSLPATAANAAGFIPAGWTVIARKHGDLNGDNLADLVLLLHMNQPANILSIPVGDRTTSLDTNPHILVVAFANARFGYRLAASNHGLFPRPIRPWTGEEAPGDDTIQLERGGLLIRFGFLRGWAGYRFRWQGGAFRLIGYDHGGTSGGCFERLSVNYLISRAIWEKGLIESDGSRVAHRRLRRVSQPTLDTIDRDSFYPEEAIVGSPLLCPERQGD